MFKDKPDKNGSRWVITVIKAANFVWRYHELMIVMILPAAVERYLFTLVNRAEGPKCMFVVVARPF